MLGLKDVLNLIQNLVLQGRGEEFQPDIPTDRNMYYPSHEYKIMSLFANFYEQMLKWATKFHQPPFGS